MAGPFARVLVQFVMVAGKTIGRAVATSFREAAARGAANPGKINQVLARRMTVDEARKILDFEAASKADQQTIEKIMNKADHLVKANSPEKEFLGSPYLQKRVENAKQVLLEDAKR